MGGIAGAAHRYIDGSTEIANCRNEGDVYSGRSLAGGIVGKFMEFGTNTVITSNEFYINCTNIGRITIQIADPLPGWATLLIVVGALSVAAVAAAIIVEKVKEYKKKKKKSVK